MSLAQMWQMIDRELDAAERAERQRRRQSEMTRRQERQDAGRFRAGDAAGLAGGAAWRAARSILRQARAGAFRNWSADNKGRLVVRFRRLLDQTNLAPIRRYYFRSQLDELIHTPPGAASQEVYVAGWRRVKGMLAQPRGSARPDYTLPVTRDGKRMTVFINQKSDRIHEMTPEEAARRAAEHVRQAIRNAPALAGVARPVKDAPPLPVHEIWIFYTHRPSLEVQRAMLQRFWAKESPISEVHFRTTAWRRDRKENMPRP